jgi:LPXTG-site transpeptidase (sortase) family protein
VIAGTSARSLSRGLRALEVVLMLAGISALGWLASTQLATARDQATWARELELEVQTPAVRPRTVAADQVVGRLELRRLGLSVIAREGTAPALLARAAGHIPATALPGEPGNAAFAAHRDTFFRPLESVRAGDEVVVTTATGRHRYVVRDTRVVSPRDVSVLEPTPRPTLTLITCFPFRYIGPAPERFVVRAELAGEDPPPTAR